jgi:ABC-type transport system substrate-binding protein
VASAIRDQLRKVGIPADVRAKPFQEYRDFLTGATGGEPGLFRSGWVTESPTPDQFLVPLFATASPDNLTGYTNPELDQLFTDTRKEPNPLKRAEGYRQAEQKILADAPIVPLASLQSYWVVGHNVSGLTVGPTGTFEGRTVSLTR